MWIKTVDGGYYNMLTGTNVEVRQANQGDYRVMVVSGTIAQVCLQKGYQSEEDATEALDEVMASQELVALEVPEYDDDEPVEDGEGDEGESEEVNDDYAKMNNDDLRAAIELRNESRVKDGYEPLSTAGNKKALVARLREDDAALASANA